MWKSSVHLDDNRKKNNGKRDHTFTHSTTKTGICPAWKNPQKKKPRDCSLQVLKQKHITQTNQKSLEKLAALQTKPFFWRFDPSDLPKHDWQAKQKKTP